MCVEIISKAKNKPMTSPDLPALNSAEYTRYARHLSLPEFGLEGQRRLKAAKVLVVGAGGLGSPVLLYLAAAGVGRIGIVEFDCIDETNLQRQVLYSVPDVGKSKAEKARERILALNPHIEVRVYQTALTSENALDIIREYDIVADGTDNFPTRYLVNDACVLAGKVNVYASIFRFEGQVAVFNYLFPDGARGPNYRDIFPTPPPPDLVPNCAEGGVLGVLPGIIGSMQACEVIKVAAGVGQPLAGKLFLFDAASFTSRTLNIRKNSEVKIEKLIDYEAFCNPAQKATTAVGSITVRELKHWMQEGTDFQLIDVREAYEREIATIGGRHIPLAAIVEQADQIDRKKRVVFYCRSGKRSRQAIKKLQKLTPFDNLFNLEGGILAWADEVDPEMTKY
jgi:adenylyltransferase/sulfurtransferase